MITLPIALFGNLGWPEMLVILLVILLLFGGRKLPQLAASLGKGIRSFKKELHDVKSEIEKTDDTDDTEESKTDQPKEENGPTEEK